MLFIPILAKQGSLVKVEPKFMFKLSPEYLKVRSIFLAITGSLAADPQTFIPFSMPLLSTESVQIVSSLSLC
jgi:hypothetical protein